MRGCLISQGLKHLTEDSKKGGSMEDIETRIIKINTETVELIGQIIDRLLKLEREVAKLKKEKK